MVGILTFHKAINYGAVLQAYALCTAVESLGKPCSVMNYVGKKMLAESKTLYFPKPECVIDRLLWYYRLPMRAAQVRKFEKFLNKKLNLSHPGVTDASTLHKIANSYEALITGSDQVFNYEGTGEDFNYYLEFPTAAKKIAYAPSFGLQNIDEEHTARVAAALSDFDTLSVREELGADIVENLIQKRPAQVCDPTFLLSKAQWEQLCVAPKRKKPYVLIYSFGSRHLEAVASQLAAQIGADVVNINRMLPEMIGGNVKNAYAPSPQEFLGLIRDAEIVITNSFHGTALSILLEKEFYTFTNHYANSQATNNRFDTLGKTLGLADRIYTSTANVCRSPVDYTPVRDKISQWKKESLNFLTQALE